MLSKDLQPGAPALCEHCNQQIVDDYQNELTHDFYREILLIGQEEIDLLCASCESRAHSILDLENFNSNEWMSRVFDEITYGIPNTISDPFESQEED